MSTGIQAVHTLHPISGKNGWFVADEPIEFENNRLKFMTSGNLPIILEEYTEYYT